MNLPVIRQSVAALLVLAAPGVLAAEWAIEPSIDSRANLTDNINLTPGVHDNTFNWTVAPKVIFARRTEVTDVAGTASLGFNRYPGDPTLDTTDANLSLASQLKNERSSYGLSAAYIRDSTLQSELATTGIVLAREQRNLVSVTPSWSYSLTQRSSVFAQYQYEQANYEAGAGLVDYSNQQVSGGYQYLVSERTAVTLSSNYSRYEAIDGSIHTDSYGFNVGLMHGQTENLTFGLGIGTRRSRTTNTFCPFPKVLCDIFGAQLFVTTETANNGLSYNASVEYKWEKTNANFAASRDINPSGTGLVVQTDRIAIGIDHQFSERLSGNAYGAYLISQNISGLGSDTEYVSLSSSLSWKLDERWTVGTGYSFSYQKVKGAPENASANTVYLSIGYNWPKISLSR